MSKKSKAITVAEKDLLKITRTKLHDARRYARVYSGIHDINYNDLVAMALMAYIDPSLLREEVEKFLQDRNLPTSFSEKLGIKGE